MNINFDLQLIWWAPPRCATRAVAGVFKNLNFFNLQSGTPVSLKETRYSHICEIPEGLEHFDLLLQVRNPYSRILSSWHLEYVEKINEKEFQINKSFDEFVTSKYSMFCTSFEKKITKQPKYIVRYENLIEDMKNLPFLDLSVPAVKDAFDYYILDNKYKKGNLELKRDKNNQNYSDWRSYYTEEIAYKVYCKFEQQFEMFGYDKNSWKK
jgi:hypothetical protein